MHYFCKAASSWQRHRVNAEPATAERVALLLLLMPLQAVLLDVILM
jgi:hypothetical protein